jgi:hypothetical protein
MSQNPAPTAHSMIFRAAPVLRAEHDGEEKPAGVMDFIASDDAMDRYGTRIAQDWLEDGRIEAFDSNPVVPWSPNYEAPPIGRVTAREVREIAPGRRALVVTIAFDLEDERAAAIAGQYARGFLSAVSVGFRTQKVTALRELDKGHPWYAEEGYMLSGNSLMELSAVVVPGNPRALAQRQGPAWLARELLAQSPDLLREEIRRVLEQDEFRAMIREAAAAVATVEPEPTPEPVPADPFAFLCP